MDIGIWKYINKYCTSVSVPMHANVALVKILLAFGPSIETNTRQNRIINTSNLSEKRLYTLTSNYDVYSYTQSVACLPLCAVFLHTEAAACALQKKYNWR